MKAIVLDLDGTLLDSCKRVSRRNRQAVEACMAQGLRVIVATARPPRSVRQALPPEWLPQCSIAAYNGAYTICPILNWERHCGVAPEMTGSVIRDVLEMQPDADLSVESRDRWYCSRRHEFIDRLSVLPGPELLALDELMRLEATKILIGSFPVAHDLAERYKGRLNVLVTDGGSLVQISSLQASKEAAAAELCRRHGIALEQAAAFGDDTNDIGLFRACGCSVAMGNAIPELKRMANIVADSNDADGVAKVLEGWLS